MFRPLAKAALYHVARRTGTIRPRPLNLTFSVTYRCNAKCRTCNVWSMWDDMWFQDTSKGGEKGPFYLKEIDYAR